MPRNLTRYIERLAERFNEAKVSLSYRPDDKYDQEWEAEIAVWADIGHQHHDWKRVTGFGPTPFLALDAAEKQVMDGLVVLSGVRQGATE